MLLSLRDAAQLLGRPRRTLRAQLARGEVRGFKRDNRWWVPHEALPLTASRLAEVQRRAATLREELERALPSRTGARRPRSVADFGPFRATREVLAALPAEVEARRPLRLALHALATAVHRYTPADKLASLSAARDALSEAVAELLLDPGIEHAPTAALVRLLEQSAIAPLGGLIRWAEETS